MQWSYFTEATGNSVQLISPSVGYAFNTLKLKFKLSGNVTLSVSRTSQSSFLKQNSEIVSECSVDQQQNSITCEFDLSKLKLNITTYKLSFVTGQDSSTLELALTPDTYGRNAVFVVGSPRSGTTAIGNTIQRALNVKSHGESHMAELVDGLIVKATEYVTQSKAANNKGTLAWEVPAIFVKAQLMDNFRQLYASYYPQKILIDKTPGIPMLEALPTLLQIYPNAKVVYCQRRGIENIDSRMRKFKDVSFATHCKQWVNSINKWASVKKAINEITNKKNQWFIEIEQFELATDPVSSLTRISHFLDLKKQALNRMQVYLENSSPQKTSSSPSQTSDLQSIDWTQENKETFLSICANTMVNNGYSLDTRYFLNKDEQSN